MMETIDDRIERTLTAIRPYLQADGGSVCMVRFRKETGVLEVRWEGTCLTCPMSQLTLRAGVERMLMKEVPEIRRVEAVSG